VVADENVPVEPNENPLVLPLVVQVPRTFTGPPGAPVENPAGTVMDDTLFGRELVTPGFCQLGGTNCMVSKKNRHEENA